MYPPMSGLNQTPEPTLHYHDSKQFREMDPTHVKAFRENLQRYPLSSNAHDMLEAGLEKLGKFETGLRTYQEAIDLPVGTNSTELSNQFHIER